jgi:hypothetical protein
VMPLRWVGVVVVECEDELVGACAGGDSSQVCPVMLFWHAGSGFEFPLYGPSVLITCIQVLWNLYV